MTTPQTITLRAPEVRPPYPQQHLQLRDVDSTADGRFLEGRAVPYGEWADIGWFLEQHEAGSFARSITEAAAKLPLLLWHDSRTFPVGVSDEWRDNEQGLDVVWRMDNSDSAREAIRHAEQGTLTGLSIGFAPIRSSYDYVEDFAPELGPEHKDKVTRHESRLLEVSLTPTPAFVGAQVSLVRSRDGRRPDTKAERREYPNLAGWRDYRESIRRG